MSKRRPQRRCLLRTVACPELRPDKRTQADTWFLPPSCRTRIPPYSNFPGQWCSPYTAGPLNLSCIRSDACQPRTLGRTLNRARIPRWSCECLARRRCSVQARARRTRSYTHQPRSLRNLRRSLQSFRHSCCGMTRAHTLEQRRTGRTLLSPWLSCICLRHTPHSSPRHLGPPRS